MLTRSFRAMGTEVELFLDASEGAEALLAEGEHEFERLESLLSRFRPDSELSRLNRERSLEVGDDLLELVRLSLDARDRTGGRFDPTVHDALVAAGYDRTFDDVVREPDRERRLASGVCAGDVSLDEVDGRVTLGSGCCLDLGGIAKGWAADRVVERLSSAGPALVNAGGDVSCTGGPWHIGVDTSSGSITLELLAGGLATSGRDRRRWVRGGRHAHHLIDPTTGAPADTELIRATVTAETAAEAEVRATALFLAGTLERAAAEADAAGIPAVLVAEDGLSLIAGGLG
jgi:thiamine biosynthesis lipoprotein